MMGFFYEGRGYHNRGSPFSREICRKTTFKIFSRAAKHSSLNLNPPDTLKIRKVDIYIERACYRILIVSKLFLFVSIIIGS
jgi:hypothetical protein